MNGKPSFSSNPVRHPAGTVGGSGAHFGGNTVGGSASELHAVSTGNATPASTVATGGGVTAGSSTHMPSSALEQCWPFAHCASFEHEEPASGGGSTCIGGESGGDSGG